MAHVKVSYVVEDRDGPEWKYQEGTYKRVIWNGKALTIGNKTIITQALSTYGINDIEYLEIDGTVYRDVRPETLKKEKEEREQRLMKFLDNCRRKED